MRGIIVDEVGGEPGDVLRGSHRGLPAPGRVRSACGRRRRSGCAPMCSGTGGRPSRSSTKLSALIRSGAVSTSVPSRSNTMVGAEVIANRYRSRVRSCKYGQARLLQRTGGREAGRWGKVMREFSGKTAFVTGGASGIGLALGRAFAEAGMNVMLADIERECAGSRRQKPAPFGPNVRGVICDVADPGSVERAAKAAFEAFGNVHVVCNNAGVAAGGGIDNISLDNWRWVLDVNLMGVLHGIRTFLPHIRAHGEGGHIVNTASMAGMNGGSASALTRRASSRWSRCRKGSRSQLKPHRHWGQRALSRATCAPASARADATGRSAMARRSPSIRQARPARWSPRSPSACEAGLDPVGCRGARARRDLARTNSTCSRIRTCARRSIERFAAIQAAMDKVTAP